MMVCDEDVGNLWELEKEVASDRQVHSYLLKFKRSGSHLRWSTPHAKDSIGLCEMGSVESIYSMLRVSDRTQTHIKSTPRKEFRLNWLEPNHWSRSSYTSTVLVGNPTPLLFVADVVDGVTLSSLGQGGSAAQQSNGPSASEAGTARTVTLWNGINFTGRIFGMSVNWSPFNQCTVLCKIEIGFKRYGIFIILNINVNLKTWTKRKGLELGHKRTRVFILPPNANHNAGQPAQGKFQ